MSFQKRGALNQITKDTVDLDDEYSRDEEVEVAKTADATTLAKRKILPLPKRRAGGSSAPSATGASNGSGSGFSGFSGLTSGIGSSAPSTGTPLSGNSEQSLKRIAMNEKFVEAITAKVKTLSTVDLSDVVSKYLEYSKELSSGRAVESAKPQPKAATQVKPDQSTSNEKPKSLFSFGAAKNFTASKPEPTAESKDEPMTESKPFTFSSEASKPFAFSKTEEPMKDKPEPAKPFTFGSEATKPFAFSKAEEPKKDETEPVKPFTFGSTPSGPAFSFGKTGTASTAAPAASFSFNSKPAASAPASSPTFAFGGKPKPEAEAQSEKKADEKIAEKAEEKTEPEKSDKKTSAEESDSDSDEEIDITKGPSFTLAAPPTTKDSPFTFKKQQSESKSTGPTFTFDQKVNTGGFTFKAEPAKPVSAEPAKPESTEPAKPAENDYTWKPSQGIVFGGAKTDASKPTFAFGAASSTSTSKPFTFGTKPEQKSNEAESTEESSEKPAFAFGKSDTKPGFSFGATTKSDSDSSNTTPKPFTFGSKPEGEAPKPFTFGSKPAGEASKPFTFGSSSTTITPSTTPAFGVVGGNLFKSSTAQTTASKEAGSDASAEPDDTPKTATDSDDLSGQGPGEENEDNVAEYRVKLYKMEDGTWNVNGVGQLRVLVDKDTKKARLLMRAEQSGRVLLNCVVRKELTYGATKTNVSIIDFDADSKPIKYMARIKTADEAEQLSKKIEEVK